MKNYALYTVLVAFLACDSPKIEPNIDAAVVSAKIEASEAGKLMFTKGGNAFDAMAATSFALAVVYPQAGNITGGGFMVYRKANGETGTLDYRETAPSKAHKDLFLDENGDVVPNLSRIGGLAIGVPGAVAGILEAHSKMGKLPLSEVIQPAITLAEEGYVLTEKQVESLARNRSNFIEMNGEQTFFGKAFQVGDTIKNPALAKTMNAIKEKGNTGFYKGWVAKAMLDKIEATGGIMTQEDLLNYRPFWRDPIVFSYKTLKVISMGPPSSGGITLGQLLKMVKAYDIKAMGHNAVETMHLMAEAERRAYADRNHFLGDPDFVAIPSDLMLEQDYLWDRMNDFNPMKATPSSQVVHGDIIVVESEETTHFSIVDPEGNAVAVTTTLNGSYGSHVFVEELGVFMNNEMDDFSSKPGVPNMFGLTGNKANSIAPNKRMLSSMTPTIVEKNDSLYMVLGTPGGSTIITSVFQTLLNVYEFDMEMQEAVNAPRFHHQWLPDYIRVEQGKFKNETLQGLKEKGHTINEKRSRIIGKVDAILVNEKGKLSVGADPRGEDAAATLTLVEEKE